MKLWITEQSELDLAPDAPEGSKQLRRSPNSSNQVFGLFRIVVKSATRIWICGGVWQLFVVVIVEEEKGRGRSRWWGACALAQLAPASVFQTTQKWIPFREMSWR